MKSYSIRFERLFRMIKIQEHLNKSDIDTYFNQLLVKHWEELNPKEKVTGVVYSKSSLIKKCEKYYNETNTFNYIKDYANNQKSNAIRHRKFFRYLKNKNYKNLRRIVYSKPEEFDLIKSEILRILISDDLYSKSKNGSIKQTKFGKLLSDNIFGYSKFRSSTYCVNLYKELGFEDLTCPYCNSSEIEIIPNPKKNKLELYADLDHFYPKSQNPFFAVSFFNLIPSCTYCNSKLKRDLEFSITTNIHPFYESFDDIYKFSVPLLDEYTLDINDVNIEVKNQKLNDTTLEIFNLKERMTSSTRIKKLIKILKFYKNNYKKDPVGLTEAICDSCDIPVDKKDILKFMNGKLLRDIALQLDEGKNLLNL